MPDLFQEGPSSCYVNGSSLIVNEIPSGSRVVLCMAMQGIHFTSMNSTQSIAAALSPEPALQPPSLQQLKNYMETWELCSTPYYRIFL